MLSGVVLGRTDLCNDLKTKDVELPLVLKLAKDLFTKLKEKSLKCIIGGVTPKTALFIQGLDGLIDGFETRKVVFTDYDQAKENLEEGIKLALDYELCWYELKRLYYGERYKEDEEKIKI